MPYGIFVAGGAFAGVISMLLMINTESPRATPLGDTFAVPQSVVLERDATVMFETAHADVALPSVGRVEMPIGQSARVYLKTASGSLDYRTGTIEAADARWVQLWLSASQIRIWIPRDEVRMIETYPGGS